MKTFLGFTTGIFVGIFVGAFGYLMILLTSKELRDFVNDYAEDLKQEMEEGA